MLNNSFCIFTKVSNKCDNLSCYKCHVKLLLMCVWLVDLIMLNTRKKIFRAEEPATLKTQLLIHCTFFQL